ncbi:hypothetical protein LOC68_16245 [Blastopirellula sp. JC732]|uniref:Uncharacterized protein n=1 Tax=Blastopirellula sediminis TaxID=2894196 RepID=A0A9X1MMM7_9BACT|nr:hypothetical protein [Blastopirellula sediminis]MCC9606760.1 hypothetical protein [Blastopirellula sediminis]MCC9629943.1 hypothetical protein [Blastopirellula sediminis]
MANPPAFPHKPSPGAGRNWPIIFPLVVFGSSIALTALIVCSSGFLLVTGTQFHPDGFRIRQFVAARIPIIGVQAGPTAYVDQTPPLSQLLVDRGWISRAPLQLPEDKWDLINMNVSFEGSPRYLTDYLQEGNTRVDLQQWSKDNPLLAGMLWSEVEKVAQLKLYWMAPEMIDKMVDFSRLKPITKSLTKDARADLAKKSLTAFLLESYKKTEEGAKATGKTDLAAACRKEIERLETVGVVILKETKNSEKEGDTKDQDPKKSEPKKEAKEKSESQDASN